ncbi:MAG: signal recognition particle-docking protein FtsY [Pirellulales bacterium]|nr:signal recognition particle-docking protein FtsY [Pirellulales bacterium]
MGDEARTWFQRLREGLARTREHLGAGLEALAGRAVDDTFLAALEEALIRADVGVSAAAQVTGRLRQEPGLRTPAAVRAALRRILLEMLGPAVPLRLDPAPAVVLILGVNGSGKTTTIAKLAHRLQGEGRRILLVAADTFRAAGIDQLAIWARRVGVDLVRHQPGGDPGAVVFDGLAAMRARGMYVLIVDTAGRLHTKVNLMEELKKIDRVIARALPNAPVERLLVLDASTGQNGLAQARHFHGAVGLTGAVLAKLDGTAKGGIVVAVAHELKIPITFVGVGERPDDLVPFDPDAFVDALLAAPSA